jgi:O-antigen/teichoic acid export membrane protein
MKVLKNYAYNLSYQLLVIILPIITTPYVTRVFSSNDLGTYGYFNSIVTYFILLATLGVANYGTKEISGHRKDIQKISKASIISAFCIGLLYLFLLSLTAPQFNAFRLILISDTSMLLLGLGLIEILFCGK